jgi:hypothetical protein
MSQEPKFKLPTETIELPSQGLLYPKDNPLSSGKVEMKYMTALEEDILTNQNYIANGTVYDKLIESLLITKINVDDLLQGDKDALLIAARILGYGKDYKIKAINENGNYVDKIVDLSKLKDKLINEKDLNEDKTNEFTFTLPNTGTNITFKLLTHGDEKKIRKEIEGLNKLFPNKPKPELSTRLKYIITSVEGERDTKTIREFVDKGLLAIDSRELRNEIKRVSPGVDLIYKENEDDVEGIRIPINLNFFWPESTI